MQIIASYFDNNVMNDNEGKTMRCNINFNFFPPTNIHYNFENIGSVEWIAVVTFRSVDRRLSVLVLFCWRVPVLFTSGSECESVQ